MLTNYKFTTPDGKSGTMLGDGCPDIELANVVDKFGVGTTLEAVGGYVNQVSTKIAVLPTLAQRREALASVSEKYREKVKQEVIKKFDEIKRNG